MVEDAQGGSGGTEPGADLGPLISKSAHARVKSFIEIGVKEGAILELDGRGIQVPGYPDGNFVGPTVFSGVKTSMTVYKEEIFGPVRDVRGHARRGDRPRERQPHGQRHGRLHAVRRGRAQVPVRDRRGGKPGINVPIRCPSPTSFTGSRGSKLGDLGPYGKQAMQFFTQVKTVTARWFDDATTTGGIHTTISLK